MIPLIGLMIWGYIIFRVVELMFRKTEYAGPKWLPVLLGVVCILVASFSCAGLMLTGKAVSP